MDDRTKKAREYTEQRAKIKSMLRRHITPKSEKVTDEQAVMARAQPWTLGRRST